MIDQMAHMKLPALFVDVLSPLGIIHDDRLVEAQVINLLCFLMFLVGITVFIILSFIPAVYGRYAGPKSLFGFGVNAKLAWFLQESPSFLVPTSLCLLDYIREQEMSPVKFFLSGLFILHYWQRYCISYIATAGPDFSLCKVYSAGAFHVDPTPDFFSQYSVITP